MSFDKKIVEEINQVRTNPKKYSEKVAKYISYFNGKELKIPGKRASIQTQEGAKAYQECADFLLKQIPLEPLSPSRGLFKSAKDYLKIVHQNKVDLSEIDADKILNKYGTSSGNYVCVDLGGESIEQSVINLLVCDGDRHRKERNVLLSSNYKLIGAANGYHPIYHQCTIIFTCAKFDSAFDENDIGYLDGYSAPKMQRRSLNQAALLPISQYIAKTSVPQQTNAQYDQKTKSTKEVTTNEYRPPKRLSQQFVNVHGPLSKSTKLVTDYQNRLQPTSSKNTGNNSNLQVVSEKRSENYSIEGGKKLKHVTIEKTMSDGSKQYEKFNVEI